MKVDIKKLLVEIENILDNHNCDYGTKEQYCLCCGSTQYGGFNGVLHKETCPIKKIRGIIKNNEYIIRLSPEEYEEIIKNADNK